MSYESPPLGSPQSDPSHYQHGLVGPGDAVVTEASASPGNSPKSSAGPSPLVVAGVAAAVLVLAILIALAISPGDNKAADSAAKELPGSMTKEGGLAVSRDSYGKGWPLKVDAGELRCDKGAVTLIVDDKTYAMNPEAQQRQLGESLAPIWAPNPAIENARMSTGKLIELGVGLCKE